MDSTFATLQSLGRDLKNSLDVASSTEIDRQLKELAHAVERVRENLERAKKSQEVNFFFFSFISRESLPRKMKCSAIESNEI